MTYALPGQSIFVEGSVDDTLQSHPKSCALRHGLRHVPCAVCLAAFWPGLIQNFQQGESWSLKWAGSPTPTITKAANAV
jgi:hypothetical protein